MRQVIAERLDAETGDIVAARTVRGNSAECCLVGSSVSCGIESTNTPMLDDQMMIRGRHLNHAVA